MINALYKTISLKRTTHITKVIVTLGNRVEQESSKNIY